MTMQRPMFSAPFTPAEGILPHETVSVIDRTRMERGLQRLASATERVVGRRAFLSGLASIGSLVPLAGAAVALPRPSGAALASPEVVENPELMALGEKLTVADAAYVAAKEHKLAARRLCDSLCPPVPEELLAKGPSLARLCDRECDVEGRPIFQPNYVGADGKIYARPSRMILKAAPLRAELPLVDGRTVFGRKMKRRLAIAEQYEAAIEMARERSQIEEAEFDRLDAELALYKIAFAIHQAEARTFEGVMLKARALEACGRIDGGWKITAGAEQGFALATAIITVMAGGVAKAIVSDPMCRRLPDA